MRPTLWVTLALIATASLPASPARAQFAAEDAAALPADGDGAYAEADAGTDPYAEPADPYAADPYAIDPADGAAPPQSIGDRTVSDLAGSVLGTKGARRVQDAETIVRTVIGRAGSNGGTPGSPGADPVGLVQDILTAARKAKDPE